MRCHTGFPKRFADKNLFCRVGQRVTVVMPASFLCRTKLFRAHPRAAEQSLESASALHPVVAQHRARMKKVLEYERTGKRALVGELDGNGTLLVHAEAYGEGGSRKVVEVSAVRGATTTTSELRRMSSKRSTPLLSTTEALRLGYFLGCPGHLKQTRLSLLATGAILVGDQGGGKIHDRSRNLRQSDR